MIEIEFGEGTNFPLTFFAKMSFSDTLVETYTSPTNIAVIKYWGKGNVKLNTPMNSSVSLTLDQGDLHTVTSIAASKDAEKDRMWLNGTEIEINSRGQTCLREIRKLAQDRVDSEGNVVVKKEEWPDYKVHIVSINTFPTGAGLASSAAGLACFVSTLAKLFNAKEEFPGQLTAIARQGSGSASRSMFGGLVRWNKGTKADGSDSIAEQIADENHWPEMRAVICVVSDKEKDTSSTSGMETSRLTSPLLKHRADSVVQPRLMELETAYLNKDFETFGQLTMKDSNQFHAICQDTYPPIFYMNDVSKTIIRLCSIINAHYEKVVAAYTFDAGPNAVIYCLDEHAPMIMASLALYFPAPGASASYCNNAEEFDRCKMEAHTLVGEELMDKLGKCGRVPAANDVKYMFLTKVGGGPVLQTVEDSVIDLATGQPKPTQITDLKHMRMSIGAPGPLAALSAKAKSGAATVATVFASAAKASVAAAGVAGAAATAGVEKVAAGAESVQRVARKSFSAMRVPSTGNAAEDAAAAMSGEEATTADAAKEEPVSSTTEAPADTQTEE